jgi:CRISPR-associated endonuclease Cas1
MKKTLKKLHKKAKTNSELMGFEGQISSTYWSAIAKNLDAPFEKRVTQGAKDLVNSSLNYAYAILYNKIQHYLILSGLSLHISYLHTIDGTKPTLTYDVIEEFRTFIADRVVFAIINKNEPLKVDKNGMLSKESRVLIAKNIKEKLGSYTNWRKESIKVENIIKTQCYNLKNAIINNTKYKGFIGKY